MVSGNHDQVTDRHPGGPNFRIANFGGMGPSLGMSAQTLGSIVHSEVFIQVCVSLARGCKSMLLNNGKGGLGSALDLASADVNSRKLNRRIPELQKLRTMIFSAASRADAHLLLHPQC